MKQSRRTRLPVDDFHQLLVALDGPIDPDDLVAVDEVRMQPDGPVRSVHAQCLSLFMVSLDQDSADLAYQCCIKLLDMNAPITDAYGCGAVAQFCGYAWPIDVVQQKQVRELADAYVAAGLWDLEQPLDGELLTRAVRYGLDGDDFWGLKPLASAIFLGNPPLAQYLVDRGASLDLGSVYAGEPPVNAIDLALEQGESEIHSIVVAALMKRKLESCSLEAAGSLEATGQATAPRRNRRSGL